jgi:hypothetical protein
MDNLIGARATAHAAQQVASVRGKERVPLGRRLKKVGGVSLALAAMTWLSSANAAPILWDASFFNDAGLSASDYGKFQSTINSALNFYTSTYESPNPLTVKVEFHAGTTGLGTANTAFDMVPYLDYRNVLAATGTSADDATALSHLPNTGANPVNSNLNIEANLPLLRALGFTTQGNNGGVKDASVTLNVNLMLLGGLDRSGTLDPGNYDLLGVTYHELNEVLGFGSGLNGVANNPVTVPTAPVETADLYRYSAAGVRSYTSDPNILAYFSIDGGNTSLANFNTNDQGDRQDFGDSPNPRIQDAFGGAGARLENGLPERTFLDVIGYNYASVSPVPVPATVWLFTSALTIFGIIGRRRDRSAS